MVDREGGAGVEPTLGVVAPNPLLQLTLFKLA